MPLPFDWEKARRETRGCEGRIHFNNAGAALMPATVADALCGYLREEEEEGGYEVMARRAAEIERFYGTARSDGRTVVRAITSPVNTGSIAFHRAMGFTVRGPLPDYDGPGIDRMLFERPL